MKTTFVSARRINPDRDGFDFEYFYVIDEDSTRHKIHVVTNTDGAELAWDMSESDLYEYSKKVFPIVVDFVQRHWKNYKELPNEDYEYFEKNELKRIGETSIDWKNYTIVLD